MHVDTSLIRIFLTVTLLPILIAISAATLNKSSYSITVCKLREHGDMYIALNFELTASGFLICFMRVLSVRAYAYKFLYRVAKTNYCRRAKPGTCRLFDQIWHVLKYFNIVYDFFTVSRIA